MKNIGESVQARLKNISREQGTDMVTLLRRFVQERMVYRLAVSEHADSFVLKGGLLLTAYNEGYPLRPSDDVDFNGLDENGTVDDLRDILAEVLTLDIADDGVTFDVSAMRAVKDRTGIVPGGKIVVPARIGSAKVDLHVDVGFGNPVTPRSTLIELPSMLDGMVPRPVMNGYPLETVIAEKLHAMAQFGQMSTRIKDHFDIFRLMATQKFDGDLLADAIETTFEHQQRVIPERFTCLSPAFANANEGKWKTFLTKIAAEHVPFSIVTSEIEAFVAPVIADVKDATRSGAIWRAGEWEGYNPTHSSFSS